MTAALYPASTPGLTLALALFHRHRRNGLTASAAGLIEVPGLLDDMGIGTESDHPDPDATVLGYLGLLAMEAVRLPWDGPIGDHIAGAAAVSIAARLLAFLLPQAESSILGFGVIPVEAWGDESKLCGAMVHIIRQLNTTSRHLEVLVSECLPAPSLWVTSVGR